MDFVMLYIILPMILGYVLTSFFHKVYQKWTKFEKQSEERIYKTLAEDCVDFQDRCLAEMIRQRQEEGDPDTPNSSILL